MRDEYVARDADDAWLYIPASKGRTEVKMFNPTMTFAQLTGRFPTEYSCKEFLRDMRSQCVLTLAAWGLLLAPGSLLANGNGIPLTT